MNQRPSLMDPYPSITDTPTPSDDLLSLKRRLSREATQHNVDEDDDRCYRSIEEAVEMGRQENKTTRF